MLYHAFVEWRCTACVCSFSPLDKAGFVLGCGWEHWDVMLEENSPEFL